jgi:hypothetical protein
LLTWTWPSEHGDVGSLCAAAGTAMVAATVGAAIAARIAIFMN